MAENKLTDKHLRNLKPIDSEQTIGDGGGLWVRVLPEQKGGAINFYYRFLFDGKERRYNCGSYPDTSLAQARQRRNEARALVGSGIDPIQKDVIDKQERKATQAVLAAENTVKDLFDNWHRLYLTDARKDKGESVKRTVERDVFPQIGDMRARDVKLMHVGQVIDRILERGARRTANLVLSLMRQMFRHGLAKQIVDTDPTLGMTKKAAGGKEVPCDRNLSFDEIEELMRKLASSDLPVRMKAATLLILATGARVGEVLNAKWTHVDQEKKLWVIPPENSKNGKEHKIQLSDFALSQVKLIELFSEGPFLLSGRVPDTALSDKAISKAIRDRVRAKPLKKRTPQVGTLLLSGGEWSPHDLRRTMASRMGDLRIQPHVIERCLNHTEQGIVAVYQRQEYLTERTKAFDTWGRKLTQLELSAAK